MRVDDDWTGRPTQLKCGKCVRSLVLDPLSPYTARASKDTMRTTKDTSCSSVTLVPEMLRCLSEDRLARLEKELFVTCRFCILQS